MRSDEELQKFINGFGNDSTRWWYQPIKFKDGVMTHSKKWDDARFYSERTFGINKWNNFVVPFLPFGLKGKVVLDIGCNAGIFLIQAVKAGAEFVYGIEPDSFNLGFYDQCMTVVDVFSEIEGIDYHKKIKILRKEAHRIDWLETFPQGIDITFAYNVLYWMTFSDEKGSIPNADTVLKKLLADISTVSSYLIIMGDEKPNSTRRRKEGNYLCVGKKRTLPFLEKYNIEKTWIENPPIEKHRHPSIIVAKSKDPIPKDFMKIDELIEFLSLRSEIRPLDKGFFESYGDFCNKALKKTLDIDGNFYKDWIKKRIGLYFVYRMFNKVDNAVVFRDKLQKDINLLFDIKENGIKSPITIIRGAAYNDGFFEIDGYHRLTICKILGMKYIPVRYIDISYEECVDMLQDKLGESLPVGGVEHIVVEKWSEYSESCYWNGFSKEKIMNDIKRKYEYFNVKKYINFVPDTVLDIGGGPYGGALCFYPDGVDRVVLDLLIDSDKVTQDLPLNVRGIKSSFCSLPFENNSVDIIFCWEALDHCDNLVDFKRAQQEMVRVLSKKGVLFFEMPIRPVAIANHPISLEIISRNEVVAGFKGLNVSWRVDSGPMFGSPPPIMLVMKK